MEPSNRWQSTALGTIVGLLNGLIALGGGLLLTPFLVAQRGLPPQIAVGTSLAVVVFLSAIGLAAHAVQGNLTIGWTQVGICAAGGTLGVAIGSKVLATLTPHWMLKAFAVLLLLVAIRLILQGLDWMAPASAVGVAVPWFVLLTIGGATGVISAIFGVGGGAMALLALATIYGMPIKEGLPVALAINVSNALSGAIYHAHKRNILLQEVQSLIPAAVIGVILGAWLAQHIPPQSLRVAFGFVLLFLAYRLFRRKSPA